MGASHTNLATWFITQESKYTIQLQCSCTKMIAILKATKYSQQFSIFILHFLEGKKMTLTCQPNSHPIFWLEETTESALRLFDLSSLFGHFFFLFYYLALRFCQIVVYIVCEEKFLYWLQIWVSIEGWWTRS